MTYIFIEPELDLDKQDSPSGSYLRKVLRIEKHLKKAMIRFSACGSYKAFINGQELDDQVFLPGRTSYQHRLQYQEYDVTRLFQYGDNCIAATLGDGWYRRNELFSRSSNEKKLKLYCHLELEYEDGQFYKLDVDESWKATQNGPIRNNDMQKGELYDARKEMIDWKVADFDDSAWNGVKKTNYEGVLVPSEGERLIEHEQLKPKAILSMSDGGVVLDFGQNLAGYMEFTVTGTAGHEVQMIFGETLDEHDNFTVKNLGFTKDKKTNRYPQTISYILKEGTQMYKPSFSIQGFRYVKLENWPEEVSIENFTAIAIYSDLKQVGQFSCSNEKINQLVSNIRWSTKSNFVDIPTDCPTRERAGWTGDIMVYSIPATYQMDTFRFLKKWLKDVILEQREDGRIRNIVPDGGLPAFMDGAAGWSDAIVKIPWVLYQFYGDVEILEMAYPAIQKHIEFMEKRAQKRKIIHLLKGTQWKYIIDTGFHWGEWLEPGSNMPTSALKGFLAPDHEVATAYFAWSAKKTSQIAGILGKDNDAEKYSQLTENILAAYRQEFLPDGMVHSNRQCRYVRPVALDLVDEELKKRLADELNEMVIQNGYRVGTGFLSTPYICEVLSDFGYIDTAYQLLENEEAPGWLYEVNKGATTIWENWYGLDDNNKPTNSLNHYSPGAIISWMYSRIAGIRPLKPGFEKIQIAPIPGGTLQWANCSYASVKGQIISNWKRENNLFMLDVTVPCAATIHLPDQSIHEVNAGTYKYTCDI